MYPRELASRWDKHSNDGPSVHGNLSAVLIRNLYRDGWDNELLPAPRIEGSRHSFDRRGSHFGSPRFCRSNFTKPVNDSPTRCFLYARRMDSPRRDRGNTCRGVANTPPAHKSDMEPCANVGSDEFRVPEVDG